MMKYKSLFIDLDDTLWDTYHNNKECLEEVYTAHHFDRYYASFEAFFEIYWPHNNLLWEQYRNNEIDRQTLIIERFRYMLRPLGIEDTPSTGSNRAIGIPASLLSHVYPVQWFPGSPIQKALQFRSGPLFQKDDPI